MDSIHLSVFSDDFFPCTSFSGKKVNYIGFCCLFIPTSDISLIANDLIDLRCLNKYNKNWSKRGFDKCVNMVNCKENWHALNNSEVHYTALNNASSAKMSICKNWTDYLINHNKFNKNKIFFNILFIDLDKLDTTFFGKNMVDETIYNKFFRTVLGGGAKYFFQEYNKIVIDSVYHDKGSVERHSNFPFLNLKKLGTQMGEKIKIADANIKFIDSDHKKYGSDSEEYLYSNLIQFADLVLGTSAQNMFYLSDDFNKKTIATQISSLIKRIVCFPKNYNSSFNYYRKQQIQIFPKYNLGADKEKLNSLSGDLVELFKPDLFYSPEKLLMPSFDPMQTKLSFY